MINSPFDEVLKDKPVETFEELAVEDKEEIIEKMREEYTEIKVPVLKKLKEDIQSLQHDIKVLKGQLHQDCLDIANGRCDELEDKIRGFIEVDSFKLFGWTIIRKNKGVKR